eukprot:CAMPEP_0178999166 /NCGR_PEP_ID=MMETSP0795-20121207/9901_1 /TAXON_ID=88552 /ORGANISM="Amoebophrya sp., Strain Ameob2" /LENGTH=58 /DNA_ID=CAMNT_0020691893 /DNA_START=133 /DNA_END=309 /DNA_ORIENTATION=-
MDVKATYPGWLTLGRWSSDRRTCWNQSAEANSHTAVTPMPRVSCASISALKKTPSDAG